MKVIKKPIEVNAWQIPFEPDMERFHKDLPKAVRDRITFCIFSHPRMLEGHIKKINVATQEGEMTAHAEDYIVQGNHDDVWVVKREIFEDTYEVVDE